MVQITEVGVGAVRRGIATVGGLASFVATGARGAATASPRTAAFLAGTSYRRFRGTTHAEHLPVPRVSLNLAIHAATDRWFVAAYKPWVRPVPAKEVERVAGETRKAVTLFDARGWLADPASYHETPPPLESPVISAEQTRSLCFERLSFPSGYRPHPGEPGRDRWLGAAANRTAGAIMLRHDEPRPWLVMVHGSGMGTPGLDVRALRVKWLHRELGLNVMLPVLPKHGVRRDGRALPMAFPTDDLLDNVHGLAQSVWDIRRLISWIRGQGDGPVAVAGVSLGGYTAALTATLEDGLAGVIAAVPVSDFPSLFASGFPIGRRRLAPGDLPLAQELHRVASPLAMAPRVPRDRRFLIGALADGMADPLRQVLPLWHHWERPATLWYEGGHIGYLCTSRASRFLRDALEQSGLAVPAAAR